MVDGETIETKISDKKDRLFAKRSDKFIALYTIFSIFYPFVTNQPSFSRFL